MDGEGRTTGLTSLSALEGLWSLTRKIKHADGTEGRFTGTARFRRAGPRLLQEEEGRLDLGHGPALRATRRYVWRRAGERLDCFFEDGRPFHSVPLGASSHETVHLCDPDRYAVAYDFADWPAWTSRWRVEGPRKDYVMSSRYARA